MASDAHPLLFRQVDLPAARPGTDCGCMHESYDVVVVGGGAAGLAGGARLGRRPPWRLGGTGVRDELPQVPGLAERWGIDVLHCPYCHGWEVRGQRIGILATGPATMHQALLFRQLSQHVTVLAHTGPELSGEQREQLGALGIPGIQGTVTHVEADDGGLTGVRLADGTRVSLDALVVAPRMIARAELLAPLGLAPSEWSWAGR